MNFGTGTIFNMGLRMEIADYFQQITDICNAMEGGESRALVNILEEAYHNGKQVFIFGNGGSGAMASHFCEDLGKGTLNKPDDKKRFKVMSLTDNVPYILAWANDEGYETIFEQQLRNFAESGDVAIGISGSGNSINVLKAIEYGNSIGMITIGVTGFDGGKLRGLAQHNIHVPVNDMGMTEAVHCIITHWVVASLKERLRSREE